jgi:UDP-N-acetylglucosamine--N-acetylmuramyl-(pentapeptide) pyrophosphoryl-undecaprenol N-acetylglucosamine transferase
MALRLFESFQPSAVVGFGGYPALPALLAATRLGMPSVIHEQNAVLGRVNRFLAGRVDAIATAYREVERLAQAWWQGPPRRQSGARRSAGAARRRFPPFTEEGLLRMLVTGGSQGARVLSKSCPMVCHAANRAALAAASDPAVPPRGYRGGARALCRA